MNYKAICLISGICAACNAWAADIEVCGDLKQGEMIMLKNISPETQANFMEYGDFSLKILFIYYIKKSGNYYETQSEVNKTILRLFNENGLEFAFPTQTIYTKN